MKKEYRNLPVHLKNALVKLKLKQIINRNQFGKLINNLCAMQIKMFKKHSCTSLINLFKLKLFWFLRFKNLKLLMFILIKK